MPINLQRIIDHSFTTRVVSFLSRVTPLQIGFRLCDLIGTWAASRQTSSLTRAVRTNQWVVRGTTPGKMELDRAVQETLQNNIRDIFTLYHYIQRPRRIPEMIALDSAGRALLSRPEFAARGLVIAGLHLSNFDLLLRFAVPQGFKAMVLTLPDPQGGRRVEYEMRKQMGMNLVPASLSSLRQAVKHLERGGTVLTGLDRPVPEAKHCPRFFGYPASLPTHHVSLARKAGVPIVVLAVIQKADGKYHTMISDPIEMEQDADHNQAIVRNAERVLKQAETFIRMAPQQWNVSLAVWPALAGVTPG